MWPYGHSRCELWRTIHNQIGWNAGTMLIRKFVDFHLFRDHGENDETRGTVGKDSAKQ